MYARVNNVLQHARAYHLAQETKNKDHVIFLMNILISDAEVILLSVIVGSIDHWSVALFARFAHGLRIKISL